MPVRSPAGFEGVLPARQHEGSLAPGQSLEVEVPGGVHVHIVPRWEDGWQYWAPELGLECSVEESDGGIRVRGAAPHHPAAAFPLPLIVVVPPMIDVVVRSHGPVTLHDKIESTSIAVTSTAGPIVVGKVRASTVALHCAEGDVAVLSGAEGSSSLAGRRVFVSKLMAAAASVVADDWAVVQASYAQSLDVRVGMDLEDGAPGAGAGDDWMPALVLPLAHGAVTASVSAARARRAVAAGAVAVDLAGLTGTAAVSVEPDGLGAVSGAVVVRAQADELAFPGVEVSGGGVGGCDVRLSVPVRAAVAAEGGECGVNAGAEDGLTARGEDVPLGADGCRAVVLAAGEEAGLVGRRRSGAQTTPGVNRGLWPDRQEVLESLRDSAGAEGDGRGAGKIASDARATGTFFEPAGAGGGGGKRVVVRGGGTVSVAGWADGVAHKAALRSIVGRARRAVTGK